MFGVSFANLRKLRKRIGRDPSLARQLWASRNHDARILATMIADPAALSPRDLDAWARDLDNYVVTDAFSALASATPHAAAKAMRWIRTRGEWTGQAGWNVLSRLARDGRLPDDELAALLPVLEAGIDRARNRVRHAMNGALIAIGMRGGRLERAALAAARRIGRVQVDHGETGCKTPDAAACIAKAKARGRKRLARLDSAHRRR